MPAEVNELDIVETDDPALLQFSDQASTYCSLSHMGDVFFVPGCCQLNMDKVAKTVQGQWKLSAGLPWQIEEREVEKDVKVYTSDVTVGWEKVQNKDIINLFCNIKHSEMNVTFCRFSRMNDKGFNLMDGIGNGRYNYYGEGLKNKECGMTITSPQNEDYGRWKCTLGVVDKGNNFTTMDRVLQINKPRTPASGDENVNIRTVLAVNTKPLTVDCDSNGVAITYCWLQHPNGTKFTPVLKEMADVPYWYSYKNLGVGECSMTLKEGSTQDSGKWLCHMGRSHPGGVELTSEVMVRVGGPIAAKESVVSVKRGDTTSIHCVTSGQKQPLKYCRFTEPDGSTVFSIDDDATKDKPILGQYYFMDKASLNFGDCAVTIIRVEAHHFGKWSCAALIQDDFMESSDYIILESNETAMSAASVTGISLGVICVVAGISLLVYQRWKRRSALLELPHRGGQLNPEPPRDSDVTVSFRVSDMSDSSTAQLNINPTSSTSPQYGTSTSIQ